MVSKSSISVANTAPVISRYGDDDTFVELSFRRLGALIELVSTRVEYNGYTGRHIREELGREIVEPEDAPSTACDLQWAAADALDGIENRYSDPVDFETATLRELTSDPAEKAEYMARARAYNAALVAAE